MTRIDKLDAPIVPSTSGKGCSMKMSMVAVLAVACLACFVLVGADAQERAEPLPDDAVEVARQVLKELEETTRVGGKRVPDEDIYTWSLRLAEAEHAAARDATARRSALTAHAERMKELDARTQALYGTGAISKAESLAATYYRITANDWLKRVK
jgi:hypothetical protein